MRNGEPMPIPTTCQPIADDVATLSQRQQQLVARIADDLRAPWDSNRALDLVVAQRELADCNNQFSSQAGGTPSLYHRQLSEPSSSARHDGKHRKRGWFP